MYVCFLCLLFWPSLVIRPAITSYCSPLRAGVHWSWLPYIPACTSVLVLDFSRYSGRERKRLEQAGRASWWWRASVLRQEEYVPRPSPKGALAPPCFSSELEAIPEAQIFLLPTPPSPGTRKLGLVPSAAWGSLASAPFLEALRDGDCPFLSSDSAAQEPFLLSAPAAQLLWPSATAFCAGQGTGPGAGPGGDRARPGIGVSGLFNPTSLEPQNWA